MRRLVASCAPPCTGVASLPLDVGNAAATLPCRHGRPSFHRAAPLAAPVAGGARADAAPRVALALRGAAPGRDALAAHRRQLAHEPGAGRRRDEVRRARRPTLGHLETRRRAAGVGRGAVELGGRPVDGVGAPLREGLLEGRLRRVRAGAARRAPHAREHLLRLDSARAARPHGAVARLPCAREGLSPRVQRGRRAARRAQARLRVAGPRGARSRGRGAAHGDSPEARHDRARRRGRRSPRRVGPHRR